ncbi:MAG: glycoside hydrolase/phage tail family protein [Devosiaceae bacterium]|nr:glycoside hydrolase/phage tail family protein [Devosiaceae bacterium]
MATLALSVAGQFAGGLVGGPIGAMAGRALGALAGSAIDNALFGVDQEQASPPPPGPLALQGSSQGGVIPKIYGWNRVAGNVIWATNLERQTTETSGAKGVFNGNNNENTVEEEILANFAIGLCEGEVGLLGRIWADGRLLETSEITYRFYKGSKDQAVDPLIELKQGVGNTPAFRGLCYLVFEGLPLKQFGDRIPNINVELCRIVGDLEPAIKAITIIPGATEFGYDPEPRVRILSPGKTIGENTNLLGQTSDWTISLDQLQALCPNLEHVALVVSWFGDDLRCSTCKVRPRVENATKSVSGTSWLVSGNTRAQAPVMTQYQGGPAYGGTPSDASVLAAIADLKTRGIKVTLYPFVLMDIAETNSLVDPYSGSVGQSAYPWRGRITSDPAPGVVGSPDQSAAMNAQVNAFVGNAVPLDFTPASNTINYTGSLDWGYRRMILHYAHLVQLAGGVDSILIGSELRGLTWLRNSATGFPFVDKLIDLAADVRSIVGAGTNIFYGADWSEYSGYQPPDAPGDKLFHLDPLWASSDIDAIGIDNYMPISDWRGNGDEPDKSIADHPHQLEYLQANIEGGEGYDWYYASDGDRLAANRTPITDGPDNEPWIWRFKDIKGWWNNPHHNRVGGVRDPSPTAWVPQSKPIWMSELGCGAVDKGPNTPNVFGDAKSVENALPYFSDGTADALAQRQFLRAHHHWWQAGSPGYDPLNNPTSNVYAGQMLDPDRIYVWTWDARPNPAFPNRLDVWSDGKNYQTGHWLTGRLGTLAGDELLSGIAKDFGVTFANVNVAPPQIYGAQINNVTSLRRAIESVLGATGLKVRDDPKGLSVINLAQSDNINISGQNLAVSETATLSRRSSSQHEAVGQLAMSYIDRSSDYDGATQTAIIDLNPVQTATATNLVLDAITAQRAVLTMISNTQNNDKLEFSLPPSALALEVGDVIKLDAVGEDDFTIADIRRGSSQKISALLKNQSQAFAADADLKFSAVQIPKISSRPLIIGAHLPNAGGDISGTKMMLGAFADPWPGEIIFTDATGIKARLKMQANMGVLGAVFLAAPPPVWDRANFIQVNMFSGHLSAITKLQALNGNNRLAVEKDNGSWEIIGFADAELIAGTQYKLGSLLRGQNGTMDAAGYDASVGNMVILMTDAVKNIEISNDQLEENMQLTSFAGPSDLTGTSNLFSINQNLAKPLSPSHLRASRNFANQDILIEWKRVTQIGGDSWTGTEVPLDFAPEEYLLSIFNGASEVRKITSSINGVTYSSTDQMLDFGSLPSAFTFSVSQVSAVHGPGNAANGVFSV